MTPRHKRFSWGYAFKNFEGQPEPRRVSLDIPARVVIPLRQGGGQEVAPAVEVGQKVVAGQILGSDPESVSNPVHSSVNGTVREIERKEYLGEETAMVVVESDGTPTWKAMEGHAAQWQDLPTEKIDELIYLSGCGSAGIPTSFRSSALAPGDVRNVIIQGIGDEVHNLSPGVLLEDDGLTKFVEGLRILKKLLSRAGFHVVLDRSQKGLIGKLSRALPAESWLGFMTVPGKYPVAHQDVLAPLVLGTKLPAGSSASDLGAIVLDVQAILHVYEAVVEGKPVIERTIALCGPGFSETPHVTVRVGSPLEHVMEGRASAAGKYRFVANSPLTGQALDDVSMPVDRTFTTVVSLLEDDEREFVSFMQPGFRKDSYSGTCASSLVSRGGMSPKTCGTNVHGERRPCIFCTFCEELCPVGVIPHLLFHHVEKDMVDETLLRYEIFKCIECRLCDYVCPSKIPLAGYIQEGKKRLVAEGWVGAAQNAEAQDPAAAEAVE